MSFAGVIKATQEDGALSAPDYRDAEPSAIQFDADSISQLRATDGHHDHHTAIKQPRTESPLVYCEANAIDRNVSVVDCFLLGQ